MAAPPILLDLSRRLDMAEPSLRRLGNYYAGRHDLSFASPKFRDAFGSLFHALSDNWCQLIVDACEERLDVQGFRFDSDQADQSAWAIWQANALDAMASVAHTEALTYGRAFVSVWADAAGQPTIAVESARQCVVARNPSNPRQRLAAIKRWVDADSYARCNLFLPDRILKYRSPNAVSPVFGYGGGTPTLADAVVIAQPVDWQLVEQLRNPLGVVPFVQITNRPTLLGEGESEFASVMGLQDAANKLLADMIVASEFGAFRQRWATGMEIPVDPTTNEPVEPFDSAISRLFVAESEGTKFGEFSSTDLSNYTNAIETIVSHIASQSRTPPHYLDPSADRLSGESIQSSESGLTSKVRRKQVHYGEAWEEVLRLAFGVVGDPRANATDAETIWSDPEIRSESQHIDAAMKRQALGVPWEQVMQDIGYSPAAIERMQSMTIGAPGDTTQPTATEAAA